MDGYQFYLQMGVTAIVAFCGWIIAHWFTSRRDRKNAERNVRTNELSKAYFALVRSGIAGSFTKKDYDGKLLPIAQDVEAAVASIHLYGSPEQSQLANDYVMRLELEQHGDATSLVNSLRNDLRADLGLKTLGEIHYARIQVFRNSAGSQQGSETEDKAG